MTNNTLEVTNISQELNFRASDNDRLPPCNIEAEEAIIGGILLDPEAIYRVKDRLKPEHFYIGAHQDLYQACLKLCKKGNPTDLLHVAEWLTSHNILIRTGGRNKLATLVDRTTNALNIDQLATLVIDKAIRRDLIRVCNNGIGLSHESSIDLTDVLSKVLKEINAVADAPIAPTKDESNKQIHDRLLKDLTRIYTGCADPSLRLFKLKKLEDDYHLPMKFMELIYLKSLTNQCSKLLTYEELKEMAGSTVREWLINGLIPKKTTILLAADGGIGKTKLAYGIGKALIQGNQLGSFITTGNKRKILYYQGDESEGDMLQALESLGYSENDIGEHVRVRFGWNADNMAVLIQDLQEFKPDVVFLDSLSTANRFSVYREAEMEYARPILEMTGLANQHSTTFVIIHHMSKQGEVRGSTAIRNAVSEVWTLSKDNSQTATAYDRILEIDKSRSRSSKKKYQLFFNPEDLSFTFLGEVGEQVNAPIYTGKEKTLQFLADHRNIRFTAQEIAHRLELSGDYTRRILSELSADGLVSVKRQPGKAYTYFLAYEGSDPGSPKDHLQDHLQNVDTASDTAKGDPQSAENQKNKKVEDTENFQLPTHLEDHLCSKALSDKNPGGDPGGDPALCKPKMIQTDEITPQPLPANNHSHSSEVILGCVTDRQPQTQQTQPKPIKFSVDTPLGTVGVTMSVVKVYKNNKMDCLIQLIFPDGTNKQKTHKLSGGQKQARAIATEEIKQWEFEESFKNKDNRYQVKVMGDGYYELIGHCVMTAIPTPPQNTFYQFTAPDGRIVRVAGVNEFELMQFGT